MPEEAVAPRSLERRDIRDERNRGDEEHAGLAEEENRGNRRPGGDRDRIARQRETLRRRAPVDEVDVAQQEAGKEELRVMGEREHETLRARPDCQRQDGEGGDRGGENDPAPRFRTDQKEQRDGGRERVELKLDLERPGDDVDRAHRAVDHVVLVEEARDEVRQEELQRPVAREPEEEEEEEKIDDVRRLEP